MSKLSLSQANSTYVNTIRIIEIDWSIKHNTKFVPEPKKKRKGKDRDRNEKRALSSEKDSGQADDVRGEPFNEATNSPHKRPANHLEPNALETPAKKQRRDCEQQMDCYSSEEDIPEKGKAPARRGRSVNA